MTVETVYSSTCPHCHGDHQIEGERFSGYAERCASCDALIQLAIADSGDSWWFVEKRPPQPQLTGRHRTRRTWLRRGRR